MSSYIAFCNKLPSHLEPYVFNKPSIPAFNVIVDEGQPLQDPFNSTGYDTFVEGFVMNGTAILFNGLAVHNHVVPVVFLLL
jgi:hypothetical protein